MLKLKKYFVLINNLLLVFKIEHSQLGYGLWLDTSMDISFDKNEPK